MVSLCEYYKICVVVSLLVVSQFACREDKEHADKKPNIGQDCSMDGTGSGRCNFTNQGTGEGASCGRIVVTYRNVMKGAVEAAKEDREKALQVFQKANSRRKKAIEKKAVAKSDYDKAIEAASIVTEYGDAAMRRAMRGLDPWGSGPRPSMSNEQIRRILDADLAMMLEIREAEKEAEALERQLDQATQKENKAKALVLEKPVVVSSVICSGMLPPKTTSTVEFVVVDVRTRCGLDWLEMQWDEVCKFDFSPEG